MRLESLKPILAVSKNWQFSSFLKLFESLLLFDESMEQRIDRDEEERAREEARKVNLGVKRQGSKIMADDDEDNDQAQDENVSGAQGSVTKQKYYEGGLVEPAEINKII